MKDGKGIFGIFAVGVVIAGIVLATGGFGGLSGSLATILKLVGIGCIGIGVLVAIIVVIALVAAFKTNPQDEHQNTKSSINQMISEKEKEVTKLKSAISLSRNELRKIQMKLDDVNRQISECERQSVKCLEEGNETGAREALSRKQNYTLEKANLTEVYDTYQTGINEAEQKVTEIQASIVDMRSRSNTAFAKLKEAEYVKNNQDGIVDELEEKAQYEEDYANALKSLGK